MHEKNIYLRILVNTLLCIILFLLIIFALPKVIVFFMPFVIAIIISAVANPMISFLERRVKILRKHSSAIVIVLAIVLIIGLMILLIYLLYRMGRSLFDERNDIMSTLTAFLDNLTYSLRDFIALLPADVQSYFSNLSGNLQTSTQSYFSHLSETLPTKILAFFDFSMTPEFISDAGAYLGNFGEVLVLTIITILASYFLIADRNKHVTFIHKHVPKSIQDGYLMITNNIKTAVGGYFKAQFKIMLVLLVIMYIVFKIMHVRYSFLIALGIAFLDFLPIFGTGAIIWPWTIICLVTGEYLNAILLIVLYIACQLIKQLLQPKMVGDSIGISPLITLIFMFIGFRFKGVTGMILGIPIGMILISFYNVGAFDRLIRGFKIIANAINEYRKF